MQYPLQDILRVRNLREEQAQNELLKARHKVDEAVLALDQAKKELEDYKTWLKEEEDRRYDSVMYQEVKKNKVTTVRQEIIYLRHKEKLLQEKVREAEKTLEEAKKELVRARALYFQSIRERQKIDEHKEVWVDEWTKEQEYLIEKEMEDFRTRSEEIL